MRRLLVTGGAGFIGTNFVHYWLANHTEDTLIVIDSLTYAGVLENLELAHDNPRFHFVRANINNQELVERILVENAIDTIVNFAAESHVDRSILGPEEFINTNIVGTHRLLMAARKVWIDGKPGHLDHRFHHISTDEVYGSLDPNDPPFSETTPYAPNSPYAASKAASDHLVRAYYHTYGLKVTTSNCSNNYGPYQFPEKLIPLVIINILNGKPIPVYGNGRNIRDWIFVDDHCRSIDLILNNGRVGEVYNIGGRNEWMNIDIIKYICGITDKIILESPHLQQQYPQASIVSGRSSESLITYIKDRPGHDQRYAIDISKSKIDLDFEPLVSFESGMNRTITWYLNNHNWWRSIISDGRYRGQNI